MRIPRSLRGTAYPYKKTRMLWRQFTHRHDLSHYMTFELSHMFRFYAIFITFGKGRDPSGHPQGASLLALGAIYPYKLRIAHNLVDGDAIKAVDDAQRAAYHAIEFVEADRRLPRIVYASRSSSPTYI
jgi:hypothetical protein